MQYIKRLLAQQQEQRSVSRAVTTHTDTHTQPFNSPLPGTTWVGQYQKKQSPTHTHSNHQTSFINFIHLHVLRSIASSLFNSRAWQPFSTTSLQVLFGLPLGLEPSTSYSMHFFTSVTRLEKLGTNTDRNARMVRRPATVSTQWDNSGVLVTLSSLCNSLQQQQPLPLYRSTCISRHLQLRTRGFYRCEVSVPRCPLWQQPAHSD